MPKLASYGSVRGARDNSRPYRERGRPTVKVTRLTQPTFGLNVSEVALRISPTGRVGSLTEQRCRQETTDHRRRNRQVSKGSKCKGRSAKGRKAIFIGRAIVSTVATD